jgi:predicted extracellular nuclease
MKKISVAAILLGALYVLPASALDWVKIGAWNIENLGERTFGQDERALAEHIFLSGVDILALEEIHDTDNKSTSRTNAKLDAAFKLLNKLPNQDWTYLLLENRDPTDTSQLCGVAWNRKRVTLLGPPFRIPLDDDGGKIWDRHPHALKFSTGSSTTDFVVIPLHMKANVGRARATRKQREREASALVAALPGVSQHYGSESDIVLLGDTNCLRADEPALGVFEAAGLKDLNDKDRGTYVSGGPFDRILVPKGQTEFRFSRQYNLLASDPGGHDSALSDHQLVMAAIVVMADDD